MYMSGSLRYSHNPQQQRTSINGRPTYSPRTDNTSRSPVRESQNLLKRPSQPVTSQRYFDSPIKGQHNSISNYKSKRPGDILDILENEPVSRTNGSTPTNFEESLNLTQSVSLIKTPNHRTRDNSKKNKGDGSMSDVNSHNTSYKANSTVSKKSAPSYIAEKVYSVKYKKSGILGGSITPLSKSKSSNQNPNTSGKGDMSLGSNRDARESDYDSYSPLRITKPEGNLYTEHTERSAYSNFTVITPKKLSPSGKVSLGRMLGNEKPSPTKANQLHRNESWGKLKSSPEKNVKTEASSATMKERSYYSTTQTMQVVSARPSNKSYTTNSMSSMNSRNSRDSRNAGKPSKTARTEIFVKILQGKFDQITQRNKRIFLMRLLEIMHEHNIKMTHYLERRMIKIKLKYFYMWQEYLLKINLERQLRQQEVAEERKLMLAAAYYDRKLKRRGLNGLFKALNFKLGTSDNSIISSNTNNLSNISRNTKHSPRPGTSSKTQPKGNVVQNKNSTVVVYNTKPSTNNTLLQKYKPKSQPVSQPVSSTLRKSAASGVITSKNTTSTTTSKPATPATPADYRSKSVIKHQKDDSKSSHSRSITPNSRVNKPLVIDGFNGHKPSGKIAPGSSPKRSTRLNEVHSKSTIVKSSQINTTKTIIYNNNTMNQSFGREDGNIAESFEKDPEESENLLKGIGSSNNINKSGALDGISMTKSVTLEPQRGSKTPTNYNSSQPNFEKRKVSHPTLGRGTPNLTLNAANDPYPIKSSRGCISPKKSPKNSIKTYPLTSRNYRPEESKSDMTFKKVSQDIAKRSSTIKSDTKPPRTPEPVVQEEAFGMEIAAKFYKRNLYTKYGNQLMTYLRLSSLKNRIAVRHRRNTLLQNAFVWLLANANKGSEDQMRKEIQAEEHYNSGLLIKGISGLIKNFVKGYKQNAMSEDHYNEKALKACFSAWKKNTEEEKLKELENEETYNEIVERFRFIVLTEKVLRQWKTVVDENKKKPIEIKKVGK